MSQLNIALFGADCYTCQIPRYRQAFKELGHKLSFDNPDIIYVNDPSGFKKGIELKKKFSKSLLILHILDVPWHFSKIHLWIKDMTKLLEEADVIAANSNKVKDDLKKIIPNEKIYVTYDISKDVFLDKNETKENMFLYVGRANDPIKRIGLIYQSIKLNNNINKIKICGSENPGFGNYLGIVKDNELNKLYNTSRYVLLPSKAEGIGLPMIEAMICGTIPITCSDNLTAKEFSPAKFICEPNAVSIVNKIEEIEKSYDSNRNISIEYGTKYKVQFNKLTIARNIISIFNENLKK